MQANLKSDAFCSYNQAASPFFWVMEQGQYNNNYTIGEVGVIPSGGSAGSYTPGSVIDVSSFLTGRDNILSSCIPPVPSLDSVNNPMVNKSVQATVVPRKIAKNNQAKLDKSNQSTNGPFISNNQQDFNSQYQQSSGQAGQVTYDLNPSNPAQMGTQGDLSYMLVPKYTKEMRSVNSIDAVDYNRYAPNLPVDPQDLRFVIEDFANQRGGFDTKNYVKSSWSNQNNVPDFNKDLCRLSLDPSRACGDYCAPVSGYSQTYMPMGKPPAEPNFPFTDITGQQMANAGSAACGPRFFYGPNYDQGSCPPVVPRVFKNGQQ